jgi:L-ascorbate metabolism protein UlaG (beta-lactamase superfamily)
MGHVRRAHDFARPFSAHVIHLIDLDPSCARACRGRRIFHRKHVVRDRARVPGLVPLHLDRVTRRGVERLDGLAVGGRHVARHVVAGEVRDRGVGGRHADADGWAGGDVVDEDGVKVLVGGDGGYESGGEEGFVEHGW